MMTAVFCLLILGELLIYSTEFFDEMQLESFYSNLV